MELIHQNGLQKISTTVYYVEPCYNAAEEGAQPEFQYATIYVLVDAYGMVPVAQYDKLEDASAIFAHMVDLDKELELAVLPKDDPAEIQEFLTVTKGYDYFHKKIMK